jgi:hypothetical protein
LKTTVVVLQIVLLFSAASRAQTTRGALCVAPIPLETPTTAAPGLGCSYQDISLKIDAQKIVAWPHKDSLKIEHLDVTESHRVTVLCGGKAHQSFRFRFTEYQTTTLCLFINDFYQTIQLWEPSKSPWCKCK